MIAAVALLLAACGGGTANPTPSPAGGGASSAPAATGGGASGASAGTLDACSFLSADQIATVVGWQVGTGVKQNTDTQTDCEWTSATDQSAGLSLTISDYDDSLFQAGASAGNSTAVSGVGDAAFKGWPHSGDLVIKIKGYQVVLGIVDFSATATTAKLDDENLKLANLVLPKL
ncbi:MAG: DUF3558 family protein [Candidatus Limnocylindrales bacterium]